MADEPEVILELFKNKSKVQLLPGNYRGLDGLRVVVDFDGGRVPAHSTTPYRPEINEPVWVAVIDGVAYMIGPTIPKPGDGVVDSTGIDTVTVTTDIGDVTATHASGATFTPGDEVKLYWSDGCHIIAKKSTTTVPGEVPSAPGGGGIRIVNTFTAIDSGSYQSGFGWRINDVWSSASNIGAWFYGTKIRDTIPDTAVIVSADIYLPLLQDVGAAPFGRHAYATKPSGSLSFAATSTLPGKSGWVPIPTTLIDELKVNTGGLGYDIGGYNIWAGTQKDGLSGAVRVTYDT